MDVVQGEQEAGGEERRRESLCEPTRPVGALSRMQSYFT